MLTLFPATLPYLRARLRELQVRQQGVTAVEYALMVAIIAVLLVSAFYVLYQTVDSRYRNVGNCLSSGPVPDECSPPVEEGS